MTPLTGQILFCIIYALLALVIFPGFPDAMTFMSELFRDFGVGFVADAFISVRQFFYTYDRYIIDFAPGWAIIITLIIFFHSRRKQLKILDQA